MERCMLQIRNFLVSCFSILNRSLTECDTVFGCGLEVGINTVGINTQYCRTHFLLAINLEISSSGFFLTY